MLDLIRKLVNRGVNERFAVTVHSKPTQEQKHERTWERKEKTFDFKSYTRMTIPRLDRKGEPTGLANGNPEASGDRGPPSPPVGVPAPAPPNMDRDRPELVCLCIGVGSRA